MALRVAFDLDGVLADMGSELKRCAELLFGEGSDTPSELNASEERRLWQHVETVENFWERFRSSKRGPFDALSATADDNRWDIIFLTTRPPTAGATVQVQSQRWLQSKGFPLPSVYVVYGSRGKVASALDLDVVIDDRLDNCLDVVADSKARPILFLGGESKDGAMPAGAQRLGIDVVQTMVECLELLAQLESAATDKPGIVKRVMRTLGLIARNNAGARRLEGARRLQPSANHRVIISSPPVSKS